jgi:hypothetical protein
MEKELEGLKRKVSSLQKEAQEVRLLEMAIYRADADYDEQKGIPISVKDLSSGLLSSNAFDPGFNFSYFTYFQLIQTFSAR